MPETSFCGPNKSWPVPDCQHVATARAYLANPARTKNLSSSQKASIRACVNRKAKALSCSNPSGKKKDTDTDTLTFASVEELINSQPVNAAIDELVTEKDQRIAQLEGMLRDSYIGQIADYGKRLERKWASEEEYLKRFGERSVESLGDTLRDLRTELGINDDQDRKNNDQLKSALDKKPDEGEEPKPEKETETKPGEKEGEKETPDGEGSAEGEDAKPQEDIHNPGQRKEKEINTSDSGSILAKVLKKK